MMVEAIRSSDGARVTLDVDDEGVNETIAGPMHLYAVSHDGRHIGFAEIDPELLKRSALPNGDAFVRCEVAAFIEARGYTVVT